MHAYVYPYNHKNMFLGCPGRGPGPWQLWAAKMLRNWNNWKYSTYALSSYYW